MTGGGWNEGYVVDVSYTEEAYRVLTPTWLSFIAAIHGQPPIDFGRTLSYLELGCGNGLTSCLVAASTPNVDVWACDFNPTHVERARSIASGSGLTNCAFEEASFEQLAGDVSFGPHEVDMIVLHGVYSWVGARNRQHIVDIIRQRLKPGGLLVRQLQRADRLGVDAADQRGDERPRRVAILARPSSRYRAAMATLHQLAEDGARSFPLGRSEQQVFEMMRDVGDALPGTRVPRRLVHAAHVRRRGSRHGERQVRLHRHDPSRPTDSLGSACPADSSTTGSSTTATACSPRPCTTSPAAPRSVPTSSGEVCASRPAHEHELALAELSFAHLGRPFDLDAPITTPFASVRLNPTRYGAVIERLTASPATLGELAELPPLLGEPMREVVATVAMLARLDQVAPVVPGWEHLRAGFPHAHDSTSCCSTRHAEVDRMASSPALPWAPCFPARP